MGKGRLEAFSDGVLAILITIMVLELKVPRGGEFASLRPLVPVFLSYVLSFIYRKRSGPPSGRLTLSRREAVRDANDVGLLLALAPDQPSNDGTGRPSRSACTA
jgi:hypothetical protein